MFLSVIIPIYNVEKYLEDCLDSIVKQEFQDYEIVLVNDGSTDRSAEIGKKYASKYSFIQYVTQENKGPSSARNKGLEIAKGEYIQFIDADDYIDSNMFEELYECVCKNDASLFISGVKYIDGKKKKEKKQIIENKVSYSYQIRDFLLSIKLKERFWALCYVWNKLYKRSIIGQNNIRFDEKVNIGEDFLFNITYIEKSNNVFVISDAWYNYRKNRDGSITSMLRLDEITRKRYIDNKYKELYVKYGVFEKYRECYELNLGETAYYSICNCLDKKHKSCFKDKKNKLLEIFNSEYKTYILSYLKRQKGKQKKIEEKLLEYNCYTLYILMKMVL